MNAPQQFLMYQSEEDSTRIDMMLRAEKFLAEPEAVGRALRRGNGTISEQVKHFLEDGELSPVATVRLFRTVQPEGARRDSRG